MGACGRLTMMNGYFLLIGIILGVANADVQYYISEKKSSYAGISTECTLAAPPIEYSHYGNLVGFNKSNIHDPKGVLIDGRDFWIGYVEAYVALLYKGCASTNNVSSSVHMNMTKDPGTCFSKCETYFIGLQEKTCHCITRLPAANQLFENGCTSSCAKPLGVLCGNLQYVSVYQKVLNVPENDNNDKNCLAYVPSLRQCSWETCTGLYAQTTCQADSNGTYLIGGYAKWIDAIQKCLKYHLHPVNPSTSNLSTFYSGKIWTGAIFSTRILPLTEISNTSFQYQQRYVVFNRGKFRLEFRPELELYSICVKSLLPTPSSNLSPSRTWTHRRTETTADNGHLFSTPETSESSVPISEDTNKTQKTSGTSVVIYIAIPVSLLVIIGVIVFILWKRRYIKVCKDADENCDETTTSTATTVTKLDSEPCSQEKIHNYYVLEPMDTYDSIQEIGDDVPNENCYDTTSGVSKGTVNPYDSSSVYNKLDNVDTYNHIGGVVRAATEFDDTYNHTEVQDSEHIYNSTAAVPKCDKVNNYSDDTYSKMEKRT